MISQSLPYIRLISVFVAEAVVVVAPPCARSALPNRSLPWLFLPPLLLMVKSHLELLILLLEIKSNASLGLYRQLNGLLPASAHLCLLVDFSIWVRTIAYELIPTLSLFVLSW